MAGAPESELSALHAAVLWAGEGCALSHGTAATLWMLSDRRPLLELATVRDMRCNA